MTAKELQERQKWSLEQKIDHALGTIDQFYQRLNGQVYISFSGGKDSTVLYWLARKIYPDIKAVFCNTGNEYPDIVKFVRGMKEQGMNIDIIYPKMKPKEVISKYGFPLVSKVSSMCVRHIRTTHSEKLKKYRLYGDEGRKAGTLAKKWHWLVNEQFDTSEMCCEKLKKQPFHEYEKKTGLHSIQGLMAGESKSRQELYLRQGQCNVFSEEPYKTKSMPLSIWLEQDIWDCIEKYKIPIAEIYKKGANRTGCMFCAYGVQFPNDNRLQLVYNLFPKWYTHFMKYESNGVTYREAIRKVLAVNGLHLPDEKPKTLFDNLND